MTLPPPRRVHSLNRPLLLALTMAPFPKDRSSSSNNASSLMMEGVTLTQLESEHAIHSLQKFVQFPTVSAVAPDTGAYKEAAGYLMEELESLGFLDSIFVLEESPEHSPVVVAKWTGRDESLPVLLLNSHYDVVPAVSEDWTVPPFEGLRKDGNIYGRGTQDMKCVCIQYIAALRKLRSLKCRAARESLSMNSNDDCEFRPERTLYLTFVPDEECGGAGMAAFLMSSLYKSLPGIALALDEGLASTDETFSVFYGERLPWWVEVKAHGHTGHGSRFIENTAVEQLIDLSNKALAFREGQRKVLHGEADADHSNCSHAVAAKKKKTLGDVTTLNITTLQAGVRVADTYAYNVVPPTASCSLDIRISPHTEPKEIGNMLDMWCKDCSKDEENKLSWSYITEAGNDLQEHSTTSTDKQVNPWYGVFTDAMKGMGHEICPQVFPAATDSRFLRALGIRALGFSPMRNTEIMLHENDEYIPESVFLEGIVVYVGILDALVSATKDVDVQAGDMP
jgi:aminoacylase